MPEFDWNALDTAGNRQQGRSTAPAPTDVASELRDRGMLVLGIRPIEARANPVRSMPMPGLFDLLPIRSVHVELALHQIAVMLRSGLTLLATLQAVAEQSAHPRLGRVWRSVIARIEAGASLADSMQPHRCFSSLVVHLTRVGEQTGQLDAVLSRAAETLEQRRTLRTHLLTAMMYPAIVFISSISVALFLVMSVIPKVEVFLRATGRRLPGVTVALLDVSTWLQLNGRYVLIGSIAMAAGLIVLRRWQPGRIWTDHMLLRIPVFGALLRIAATASFSRSMSILLRSGVSLLESLRTSSGLLANQYMARVVDDARERVLAGSSLAPQLATPHAFLPMLPRMVAVGESAGTLDDVLDEVTRFHEMQLQSAIRRISALIEPLIILFVGSIVGFVYIAFFLALFAAGGAR
ncbi:MAG: type II secretion system F family protein [Planctomycetota bacterium]